MERAPRQMCAANFKKKMLLEKMHQKVLMTNYDQLYPPILKLYTLKISRYGKPDFAAVSRTHDMHRLALLIR